MTLISQIPQSRNIIFDIKILKSFSYHLMK